MKLCLLRIALLCAATFLWNACNAKPQTSTITLDDLTEMTTRMSQSLRASEFFAKRDASSLPAIIVTNKVENLTSDIIQEPEEWMLIARVQNSMPINELANLKNVQFVIPPERAVMVRNSGYAGAVNTSLQPTHEMNAIFMSTTRAAGENNLIDHRQDSYYMEYKLIDLRSRQIVWTDKFEYKRVAEGIIID